jgi:phosphoribosylformylglycinamidine cyclo-ligase
MPAVYAPGELDVVGFVTGVVDRDKLITGAKITANNELYGVSSTGLHTNGWSLARKLLFEVGGYAIQDAPPELGGSTLAEVLLEPHANYVPAIRRALDAGIPIKGMAHITGGGLVENVPRILPEGLGALIGRASWTPQPIFTLMQKLGRIDDLEMHRTFNMGVGLVIVAPVGQQAQLAAAMAPFRVWELGRVEAGAHEVRFAGVAAS